MINEIKCLMILFMNFMNFCALRKVKCEYFKDSLRMKKQKNETKRKKWTQFFLTFSFDIKWIISHLIIKITVLCKIGKSYFFGFGFAPRAPSVFLVDFFDHHLVFVSIFAVLIFLCFVVLLFFLARPTLGFLLFLNSVFVNPWFADSCEEGNQTFNFSGLHVGRFGGEEQQKSLQSFFHEPSEGSP